MQKKNKQKKNKRSWRGCIITYFNRCLKTSTRKSYTSEWFKIDRHKSLLRGHLLSGHPLLRWRRTLAHEYINEPNFCGRCLLLTPKISTFFQSIALKLNADIGESWNYIAIVVLLADRALLGYFKLLNLELQKIDFWVSKFSAWETSYTKWF